MKAAALAILLASSSLALADKPAPKVDVIATQLDGLKTAAKCADATSPWRPWCIATRFATGTVADLPKGKVLVGLSIRLEKGKDLADALSNRVTLAALAIDADGKVKLTDVTPSNDGESTMIGKAVFNASAVFKGKATSIDVPKELAGYIGTLKGAYAATRTATEWTWTGKSAMHLRKVDKFWVAIEVPDAQDGIFATILTDAWAGK